MLQINNTVQPAFGGTKGTFRDDAIKTISLLKEHDYNITDELRPYVTDSEGDIIKDKPLSEIWKSIEKEEMTIAKQKNIYEYPIKYVGNSPNRYLYKLDGVDIYIEESTQYRSILNDILKKSQEISTQKDFGTGAKRIQNLFYETFRSLYSKEVTFNGKTFPLIEDEAYFEYVNRKLRNHYQLIIYKDSEGKNLRLMIPLYGVVNKLKKKEFNKIPEEDRLEFTGGIMHYLQHFTLKGNPISAIDKRQNGNHEFLEKELLTNIIDGVNECNRIGVEATNFKMKSGEMKKISIYKKEMPVSDGEKHQVIFVNSIY